MEVAFGFNISNKYWINYSHTAHPNLFPLLNSEKSLEILQIQICIQEGGFIRNSVVGRGIYINN